MKKWKQMISGLLVICMLIAMIPVNVSANERDVAPSLEETMVVFEPMFMETSADNLAFFGLDQNGNPEMKDAAEVRWIDRIKDLPDYAMGFYDWMIENSDGDGTEDALINVTQGMHLGTNTYVYPVTTINNVSADFTYDGTLTGEALNTARNNAANNALNQVVGEVTEEYRIYIATTASAFNRDHSEVFWLDGTVWTGCGYGESKWNYDDKTGTGTIYAEVNVYYYLQGVSEGEVFDTRAKEYTDSEKIYSTITELELIIDKVVEKANSHYSENKDKVTDSRRTKLDYFNDWLTEHNCYNTSDNLNTIGHDCRSIVSALKNDPGTKGPVCEAYARAFKVLCDRIKVPCVLVSGTALSGNTYGEHMWNYVQMNDNKWYAVDVTWNDPTGGNEQAVSGYERDTYFLIGGNSVGDRGRKFSESHTVTNQALVNGPKYMNGPVLEAEPYNNVLAELKLKGASLALQDNLSVNYKINQSLCEELAFSNPYLVLSMNNIETIVNNYTVEEKTDENYLVFNFNNIAPNKMNDTIYATLYADYNGTRCFSETKEYKIADYCYNMLEKYSDEKYSKFRTLLVDLLNYGAASQNYTGYNTDNLVNNQLTDIQRAWGTSEELALEDKLNKETVAIENPTVTWKGASLTLNDSIEMNFKMEVDNSIENIQELTVRIITENTDDNAEWIIPAERFVKDEDNLYDFCFRGLNPSQMRDVLEVTVYNGDTAVSNTISYSIESYAARNIGKGETLAALLKSMMRYGDAAAAYVVNQ